MPGATATIASQKPLRIKCYAAAPTASLGSPRRFARRARVTQQGGGMISVSDRQLRIVAAAADLLPVEARGTFLRYVVAELRGRRDFSDCDVEQAVRAALPGCAGASRLSSNVASNP